MHRAGYYILLFVVTALLQTFFFNHLELWSCFAPMVYMAFVVMLPLNAPSIVVLLLGLAMGVTMDLTMGTVGLNTIATLAAAYLRRPVLNLILGTEIVRDGGLPSVARMGQRQFWQYLVIMLVLHGVTFFGFEAFTTAYFWYQMLRLVVSTMASILFVWLIIMLFTPKHAAR
jgi:rod shape-determining protein MreD